MTRKTDTKTSASAPAPAAEAPLFYTRPAVLRFEEHAGLALVREARYGFAAHANALPAVAGEFAVAQRFYPIVFAGGATPSPLLVTGIEGERNLFVAEDGDWQADTYVPAYARRYPFISTVVNEGTELLCADLASARLVEGPQDGADVLFAPDGQATPEARQIMAFCEAVHADFQGTAVFAAALAEAGLLVEKQATLQMTGAGQYRLDGFRIVDEEAYRALPEATLVEWTRKGWTDLIVLHLASQQNWQRLLDLHAARAAA